MSLLDDINSRISQLQAATDARYQAAGYEVPTSSQRKVAEMSGQNPYFYATQLKQAEEAQKEAEKVAKAAAKAASKSSSSSSSSYNSSSSSSKSSSSSSSASSSSGGGNSMSSLFESESDSDTEEIPSIKTFQEMQNESFQRKKARRQKKGAEHALQEAVTEPISNAIEKVTSGKKSGGEKTKETEEKQIKQAIGQTTEASMSQGNMESNLYNMRNAEMAGLKAQQDRADYVEEKREILSDRGLDLDKLASDANMTPEQYVAQMDAREDKTALIDSHKDTVINKDNVSDYLDPNYQLDVNEQDAARKYIDQYKKEHPGYDDLITLYDDAANQVTRINKEQGTNYTVNDYLEANGVSVADYQEARNIEALEQKVFNSAAYVGGLTDKAYNIGQIPSLIGDKLTEDMEDGYNDQDKMSIYLSELDKYRQSQTRQAQQTQSPIAYGAGKATEMAASTMLANGVLNGTGLVDAVAQAAGGSELANVLSNIGLDTLLVDIPTDTIPEMIANFNSGMPLDQVLEQAGINIGVNAIFNGIFDAAIPGIPSIANKLGNVDSALPVLKQGDDIIGNQVDDQIASLMKQSDDAAQTLDNLARQIPEVSTNNVTDFADDVPSLTVKQDIEGLQNQWDDYLKSMDTAPRLDVTNPNLDNVVTKSYADYMDDLTKATSTEDLVSIMREASNSLRLNNMSEEQFQSLIDYVLKREASGIGNTASDVATNTARRSILDTTDDYFGATVGEVVEYQTSESKRILTEWGNNHADLISNNENVKSAYDRLNNAVDEFTDAALHTDVDLDQYYRNIDNARKKLSREVGKIDESAATDAALGNSKVSILKNADTARNTINNNTPDTDTGYLARMLEGDDDVAYAPNNTIPSIADSVDNISLKAYDENVNSVDSTLRGNALIDGAPKEGAFFDASDSSKMISPDSSDLSTPKVNTENVKADTESPDMRQRGYDKTYQSGRTNIQEGLKTEPEMYQVRHNADTQKAADDIFNNASSLHDAESKARSLIAEGDATAVPLTSKLINEYARTGDTNKAVDLLNQLEEKMTKSGQFTQAAKMTIVQNDPEIAKTYLQRQIDTLNEAGLKKYKNKWKTFELTDDELKAFSNITPGDVNGISDLYTQIGKRLGKQAPVSFRDKLNEYRKLAMLLNPRTHIRNVGANGVTACLRETTDRVSAIGQNAYKLLNSDYEVTQSILPPSPANRKMAGTVYDNIIVPRLEGTNPKDFSSNMDAFNKAFNENRQIFRDSKLGTMTNDILKSDSSILNKISGGRLAQAIDDGKITGSYLENLRRFDYYLLGEVEDNPFVKMNFESRLGSYIRAQGIKNVADIPQDVIEVAYQEALKATFKDDNVLSDALSGLKNVLNKHSGGMAGEALFPFVKTPSAIAMRGVDYSPLGLATSIGRYLGSDRSNLAVSNLFDDMSKAVTGTAAISLGFILAREGIITGALSDNAREKQFQQTQGQQAYSIKIGDRYYSYDWAQPTAIPLILGATMYNAMNTDDMSVSSVLQTGVDMTDAALNSWIDLSPLQTFSELFGSGSYGKAFAEGLKDTATSYATSYIPSIVGAAARATDNNYRTTYDNSNNLFGNAANQMIAKVPGLSQTLPKSYNTWGQERVRSTNNAEAAFAQFVNPGQLSVNSSTPIDEEISRLHDVTGSNSVYPNKASWSVDLGTENKKLTNEEYSEYQRVMGERSYELATEFITNNSYYDSLNDDNKAEVLASVYSLAKAQAESELFGKVISDGTTNSKLNSIYEEGGAEAVVNYLAKDKAIKQAGADPSDTTRALYDNGITANGTTVTGTDAIALYSEARDWLKANGLTNNGNNRQAYYKDHINEPRATTSQPSEDTTSANQSSANAPVTSASTQNAIPSPDATMQTSTETQTIPSIGNNTSQAVDAINTIRSANETLRELNPNYYNNRNTQSDSQTSYSGTGSVSRTDALLAKQESKAVMQQYGLSYSNTNQKLLDKYGETALEAKALLSDADYSFGDKEKEIYQQGGVPAIQDYIDDLNSLEAAGLDASYSVYAGYQHALEEIPSLTPTQYANAMSKIDSNDNSSVTQAELAAYLNNGNFTVEEAEQLARLFGSWSKSPYVKKDGTWGFH